MSTVLSRIADRRVKYLIQNGDFTPATTITGRMAEVIAKKHRWGVHYNMDTYDGCCFGSAGPSSVPVASTFNIPSIDFNNIVDDAHDCHVKIAYINAFHETGFNLWPSEIISEMYTLSGTPHLTPIHNQDTFNTGNHADKNIVAKFCATMRKEGIEPWLYVNFSAHWNFFNSITPVSSLYTYGDNRRAEWVLYVCLLCQELLIKYGPYGLKGLWPDSYTVLNPAEYQQLYNAIKSIDPDCWVTHNMGPVNGFHNFPGDGMSYEGYVVSNPSITEYQSIDTEVDSVTYKIPKEFIISLASHTSPQNWYYYDALCRRQPLHPAGLWLDQTSLQQNYDDATTYGCAFMTSPSLDRYGRIPAGMLDALKALDYVL